MLKSDDEVFCEAIEFDTWTQQEQYVRATCNGDADQIERVLGLLLAHNKMQQSESKQSSILERADQVFQTFSSSADLEPGTRIGAYELVEKIGEGGVGIVFRAQQSEPIQREVALKLLKPGMDSQRILARFALERQVLEQLEHPGITRILDAGVQANGRPFFAMELVRNALTITGYAERFKFNVRDRVQLLVSVCGIVQYAHQRGFIHRDLKPSNILLDAEQGDAPAPKVIDFGIAKIVRSDASELAMITSPGERFGTPAYMSPEQALSETHEADIRSDIYSLGIVLFELLTGSTPKSNSTSQFSSAWRQSTSLDWEPCPPSQWPADQQFPFVCRADLRGELDWITLKALAHDPDRRYQTVADFQRDLERFLDGEPVEAAGPSIKYRIGKFIRRNLAASLATALVFLTIVATSIVTSWFGFRALTAEKEAQERLGQVLEIQDALRLERDEADRARFQAEAMLRMFQVQLATNKALAAYYQDINQNFVEAERKNELVQFGQDIKATSLLEPHPRLIVRGDWRWASELFPEEIIVEQLKLSSRDVASVLAYSPDPPTVGADGRKVGLGKGLVFGRQSQGNQAGQPAEIVNVTLPDFRDRLLQELKQTVKEDAPFIAEVLDNYGLEAIDRGEFESAERYLKNAVAIWMTSERHPTNAVQSNLFLAETLLKQGKFKEAAAVIVEARQRLSSLPAETQELAELRAFAQQLGAE